jgi:hypothetical protein
MTTIQALKTADHKEIGALATDADVLSPKEFEQESKALLEEARKRGWLSHSPRQLAARIPVSVFAMGDL